MLIHLIPLWVVAALSIVSAATPPLSLDIKSPSGAAPLTVRARISVERHPGNRFLCLTWTQIQGGGEARTSCQSIAPLVKDDGTVVYPPRTHWQFIKDLSSGQWEVVAYVARNDGPAVLSNRLTLHVFGPNYSSE